jgi:uncharacterized protein YcgL (UPF0745 family)
VKVWIYKSSQRAETYLYLPVQDDFHGVPPELLKAMGRLELVMELDLHEKRTLARANVENVMASISEQGYYLQLPPVGNEDVESDISRDAGPNREPPTR